jgi:hypothetical protein
MKMADNDNDHEDRSDSPSLSMISGLSPPHSHAEVDEHIAPAEEFAWSLFDNSESTQSRENDGNSKGGIRYTNHYPRDDDSKPSKRKGGTNNHSKDRSDAASETSDSSRASRNTSKYNSEQTAKRAKQATQAVPAWTAEVSTPVPHDTISNLDADARRIRGVLDTKARAIIDEYRKKKVDELVIRDHASTGTSNTAHVTHGYDPLQYFRMMAAAINGGCFSDLCIIVNRVFAPSCVYRCVAIPVCQLLPTTCTLSFCEYCILFTE